MCVCVCVCVCVSVCVFLPVIDVVCFPCSGVDSMSHYEQAIRQVRYRNWHPTALMERRFRLSCSELNGRYTSNEFNLEVRVPPSLLLPVSSPSASSHPLPCACAFFLFSLSLSLSLSFLLTHSCSPFTVCLSFYLSVLLFVFLSHLDCLTLVTIIHYTQYIHYNSLIHYN